MPRASSLLPLALFISAFTSGCGEENSVGGNEGGTTSAGGATGSGGRASIGGAPNEGGAAGAPSKDRELVTLEFRARVGDQPFACGERYPGVGATDTEVTPRDLRFFVSNVRLIDAGGDEVPVELEVRSPWQGAGVALLDFEDGTASCVNGNSLLNSTVTGYAPPGAYAGLAFSTSVPVELNHADPTAQPSPLEVGTLHWSWLAGYIFFRAELASTAPPVDGETPGLGVFHLGSVGCTMDGSSTECSRPNRNDVVLQAFDAARDVVTLDLAQVFASADLSRSAMCHSHGEACGPYFAQLGVDAESGAPSEQGAFHVEEK